MGKVIIGMALLLTVIQAEEKIPKLLEQNCLHCHQLQQIPSELIYRRYLLRHSSQDRIKSLLFTYLKAPSKSSSIMPQQFFLKFPIKKPLELSDKELLKSIELYLDYFDLKKKLFLPKDRVESIK